MPGPSDPAVEMSPEGAVDRLALLAEAGLSRRHVLAGAVALAFASLVPAWMPKARAASSKRLFDALSSKVTKYGICGKQTRGICAGTLKPWTPQCTNTVSKGKRATHNGCGPEGGVKNIGDVVPDKPLDLADFTEACNEHDCCYGTCGAIKDDCDKKALQGWQAACDFERIRSGVSDENQLLAEVRLSYCYGAAEAYYQAISRFGHNAFLDAQRDACMCCEEDENAKQEGPCGGRTCGEGEECCQGQICFDPKVSRCCNLTKPYVAPSNPYYCGTVDGKPALSNVLCVGMSDGRSASYACVPGRTDFTCAEYLGIKCGPDGRWGECYDQCTE
jgi:hypothetical protein